MILRRANPADAIDVWRWRNDPVTRAMSRSQDETTRESHLAWFDAALADSRRTLLIGEVEGEPVGMVRFDRGDRIEVSINVNPAHRSKGYGQALLVAAMATVGDEVWAEIRDENTASQRLFERSGFVFDSSDGGFRRYVRPAQRG